jgi:hypothetical protein
LTFLEICQAVRQKSGLSGDGPSNVTGQTGIMQRVVGWVLDAEEEILTSKDHWQFLRDYKESLLVATEYRYTLASLSMSPAKTIRKVYVNGSEIEFLTYQEWLDNVVEYGDSTKTGTPYVATLTPDQRLQVWPTPDASLTVKVDYYLQPTAMTANSDISILPSLYHKAIMHRALMFYADYEEDGYLFSRSEANFDTWMSQILVNELPKPVSMRGATFG